MDFVTNLKHCQWALHVAFLSSLRLCFYLTHQLLPVSFYGNWKHYLQISNLRTQAYRNVHNDIIIRDFEGVVLCGWSTTKNFLVTPEITEPLTVLYAVKTCKKMGFQNIILEGNALQIVNAIKVTCNNWSSFGHTVDGIKMELRQLQSWRIELHVKRDANIVVYTIVK